MWNVLGKWCPQSEALELWNWGCVFPNPSDVSQPYSPWKRSMPISGFDPIASFLNPTGRRDSLSTCANPGKESSTPKQRHLAMLHISQFAIDDLLLLHGIVLLMPDFLKLAFPRSKKHGRFPSIQDEPPTITLSNLHFCRVILEVFSHRRNVNQHDVIWMRPAVVTHEHNTGLHVENIDKTSFLTIQWAYYMWSVAVVEEFFFRSG